MQTETIKITISKVTRTEVPKTTDAYFNKQTGDKIDWLKYYDLTDEDRKNYAKHEIETGELKVSETELKVYEQELPKLDIGELAVYINRAK